MSDYDNGYDEGYRAGMQKMREVGQTRIEELSNCVAVLEAKLERISEEWAGAVYGDLENGVASLNAAAATDFYKRYPSISSFGDTLMGILLEGETDA